MKQKIIYRTVLACACMLLSLSGFCQWEIQDGNHSIFEWIEKLNEQEQHQHIVDTLDQWISNHKTVDLLVYDICRAYDEQSCSLQDLNQYQKSNSIIDEGLLFLNKNTAVIINSEYHLANFNLTYAWNYFKLFDYSKCVESSEIGLGADNYLINIPIVNSRLLNVLGLCAERMDLFSKAIEAHRKAIEIRKSLGKPFLFSLSLSYNNIAIAFQNSGQIDSSRFYFLENLKLVLDSSIYVPKQAINSHLNFSHFLRRNNRVSEAEKYIKIADSICKAEFSPDHIFNSWVDYFAEDSALEKEGYYLNEWQNTKVGRETSSKELLRGQLSNPNLIKWKETSSKLYFELFSELDELVNVSYFDRLLVSPDGMLNQIPFEVLTGGSQMVIEKIPVNYISSMTGFDFKSISIANNFVHSTASFAPEYKPAFVNAFDTTQDQYLRMLVRSGNYELKGAVREASEISQILGGNITGINAEAKGLKENAYRFDLLHLAMHGYTNLEHPKRSGLIFSDPEQGDQMVYLRELRRMKLKAKDVALRNVKLAYLHAAKVPALQHPYYWAGFVLHGAPSSLEICSWGWHRPFAYSMLLGLGLIVFVFLVYRILFSGID